METHRQNYFGGGLLLLVSAETEQVHLLFAICYTHRAQVRRVSR